MQVLSAEETVALIAKATEPLLREIATLRKMVIENGDMISTEDAMRRTGIKELRTLKKYIQGWTQEGTGPIKWPKTAILEYLEKKSIAA